ncbi:conserved hypothetical protein, partial [Ricinus communis]
MRGASDHHDGRFGDDALFAYRLPTPLVLAKLQHFLLQVQRNAGGGSQCLAQRRRMHPAAAGEKQPAEREIDA